LKPNTRRDYAAPVLDRADRGAPRLSRRMAVILEPCEAACLGLVAVDWEVVVVAPAGMGDLVDAAAELGGASASHARRLASLWLVLVVLAPAGLDLLVKSLYPPPSRVAFIDAVRRAADASAREASRLLADYFHDHPELTQGSTRRAEFGSRRLAVNRATEAAVAPEQERFRNSRESHQAVIDGLRFLSPAIVFQQAADALAGNDAGRYRSFTAAVEAHRDALRRFFAPAFVSDAPFTDFDAVPAFDFRDGSFGTTVKEASLVTFALLVPIALFISGGVAALRRPLLGR
jgi:ABC-2 type transport system permease protein